jgi:hypothetical protein
MKFVSLTTGTPGEFYYVNMDNVLYMIRTTSGRIGVTRLTFVDGKKIDVAEPPAEILRKADE